MRETDFIDQNKSKWKELERMNREKAKDPAKLSELFVEVTNDLSYSKSYYPNRSIKVYLNNLALAIHSRVYKNKAGSRKRFRDFWTTQLPRVMYETRWSLFIAFLVFAFSMAIGVVSSIYDPGFARHILGDGYIAMTEANIDNNDPMAVYKDMRQMDMFVFIAINNIWVSFLVFILGATLCVGTVIVLISNGVMVGVFQWFFVERGLFQESFLTIWMHGMPEIMSIVLAGSAGMVLGRGILFPGTYTRKESFLIAARRGIMIMLGITPVFLFAAFVEGFATRYTELPDVLRAAIILLSGAAMVYYFIILPYRKHGRNGYLMRRIFLGLAIGLPLSLFSVYQFVDRKNMAIAMVLAIFGNFLISMIAYLTYKDSFIEAEEKDKVSTRLKVPESAKHKYRLRRDKKNPQIYTDIFVLYSKEVFGLMPKFIGLTVSYVLCVMLYATDAFDNNFFFQFEEFDWLMPAVGMAIIKVDELFDHQASFHLYVLNVIFFGSAYLICTRAWINFYLKETGREAWSTTQFAMTNWPWILLISIICHLIFFIEAPLSFLVMVIVMPVMLALAATMTLRKALSLNISEILGMIINGYVRSLGLFATVFVTAVLFMLILNSGLIDLIIDSTLSNIQMSEETYPLVLRVIRTATTFFGLCMVLPLFMFGSAFGFLSFHEMNTATGLKKDIDEISPNRRAYGLVKE
jgi:uncharacterized membrane protein SpoIIM required for sporulation